MGYDIAADRKDRKKEEKHQQKTAIKKEKTDKRNAKLKAGMAGFKDGYANRGSHICTQCGKSATPKTLIKGSFLLEIILWLCLLLPGLIYSSWRNSSKIKACPDCKTQTMVKKSSPMGKKLTNQ